MSRQPCVAGDLGDYFPRLVVCDAANDGDARFDDSGFFAGNCSECVAELSHVIEAD